MSTPTKAPDGRTWLEWAADYHAKRAKEDRAEAAKQDPFYQMKLQDRAEEHEAMTKACREAVG